MNEGFAVCTIYGWGDYYHLKYSPGSSHPYPIKTCLQVIQDGIDWLVSRYNIDGENISEVPPRSEMYVAKAPQSFYFKDIVALYDKSDEDDFKSIDASHLCSFYSVPMHIVKSTKNNLKIT